MGAKKEKTAGVRHGGQVSSARSGDLEPRGSCTGWPNARPSGNEDPQEDSNRPLLSLVVEPLGSSLLSTKVLSKERARHPT